MRSKFKWIFTLLLALSMQFSFAQEKTVTGVVSDATGALPGVSVLVKGTKKGVQTDVNGKYAIKAKTGDVLLFSFIGMKDKSVTVGASNVVNVAMATDTKELKEVVVEGYKSTVKSKSNTAVTSITNKSIEDRPNASFIQTLQGQVAGLNISTGSGQPGAGSSVILRGLGSVNGNVEPLYLVDGVPMNGDNFRSINPEEISSVSVLKDAAATSIYGNRGANGVMVVKTKRGSFGTAMKIDYSVRSGFSTLQNNKYHIMGSKDLLLIERLKNVGVGAGKTDAEIALLAQNYNADWKDYFFRTGTSQSHSLGISSGSDLISSYTLFGFLNDEGILLETGLKRFNVRNNLDTKSKNGKFRFGLNTSVNYSKSKAQSGIGTGSIGFNPILGSLKALPYVTPEMYSTSQNVLDRGTNGFPEFGGALKNTLAFTPLRLMDKIKNSASLMNEIKMLYGVSLSYDISNKFSINLNSGADYTQQESLNYENPNSANAIRFKRSSDQEYTGTQSEDYFRDFQFNSTLNLRYKEILKDKHSVTADLFMEYNKGHYKTFGYSKEGLDPFFFSPGDDSAFAAFNPSTPSLYLPDVYSTKITSGLFSYFTSADYDYNDTYGFSGTVRRDASFRFTDENKWGTFWSVAGRWNVHNESFIQNSIFNTLKLRVSYGTAGNQNILGQNMYSGTNLFSDLSAFGGSYNNLSAYQFSQFGNPNLKWETIKQFDFGVDFEILNRRINGTIDVYDKKTVDLYLGIPQSAATGQSSLNGNNGSLQNRGVELKLGWDAIKPLDRDGYKLSFSFNGSYNRNQILSLPQADGISWAGGTTINRVGDRLNQWYLVRYSGVNPSNGNLLFLDKDGVVTENPNPQVDAVYTGKSAVPSYQGGFGLDTSYKGFYLTTQFTFVADIYRFDGDLRSMQDPTSLGTFNGSMDLFRSWTTTNRITDMPSLTATNLALDSTSDRYLKDASYLRLRNITVGYVVPKRFIENSFFKSIKLYLAADNTYTWSKWRGWDAESNRSSDTYQYPTPKIFSFGGEFNF